jgi:PAS domain S-box-containing protein
MISPHETPDSRDHAQEPARLPLAWWDWDLSSDRLAVLSGQSCVLGFSASEFPPTGADWERSVHPEDIQRTRAALEACVKGTSADWFCEHRLLGADGGWHWVLNTGRITERDRSGAPARMLGVTLDIAERRRNEEIVSRDAQMLATVRQSIVCTDLQGTVLYWSDGATELYGWTAAEMLGKPFFSRMPTEEMREQARLRMNTAATRGEFRHEREDFRKDGTRIFVESRVFPLRNATGAVIGVIGTAHDITARRQAELDRLRLERQLLQAQKLETIGTLAGGVAHEFNNILSAIIGNIELAMLEDPGDQVYREYHRNVLVSSWRARDLVKRILSFSRGHEPERRPVQLRQVASEAFSLIRVTLPATVELRLNPGPPVPDILGDANELQQVLMNLAANASYAMRDSRGLISFTIRAVDFGAPHECAHGTLPAGSYLALDVADTGQGIDTQNLAKIFDPFFTTKPVGAGSGLGLAIAQSIMVGHGGGIDVASSPGAGTTFTLLFPVDARSAAAGAPESGRAPPQELARGQGERVVLIDDEESIGLVVEKVLRQLGYSVRRFSAADEFYAEFRSAPFPVELVLTDQTMPRMTGLQLARRLRADGHTFPIAIASGHSPDLTREALNSVSRLAFIEKPFDVSRLAAAVQRLLRPATAADPGRPVPGAA